MVIILENSHYEEEGGIFSEWIVEQNCSKIIKNPLRISNAGKEEEIAEMIDEDSPQWKIGKIHEHPIEKKFFI